MHASVASKPQTLQAQSHSIYAVPDLMAEVLILQHPVLAFWPMQLFHATLALCQDDSAFINFCIWDFAAALVLDQMCSQSQDHL